VLLAPGRLALLFVVAFPLGVALYIAFTGWGPTTGDPWYQAYRSWEWLDEYREALASTDFWLALWRTVLVTAVAVTAELALGLALALLFVPSFRGRSLLIVCFLLPMMVVPAVSGFLFSMLLQVDGPVNAALSAALPGEVRIPWLTDPDVALWSIVLVDVWQWTPLMFLVFLAGLLSLPEDQLDQARTLGAGWWARLRRIVLPLLRPVIAVALVIRAIEALKIFDSAWLLTQGGPGEASTTISIFLFRQTFQGTRWGYAMAVGMLVLALVSLAAFWAVRPIERAQEQQLDELVGKGRLPARRGETGLSRVEARVPRSAPLPASAATGRPRFVPPRRRPGRRLGRRAARWVTIVLLAGAFLFPLYWLVTTAFKPLPEWSPVGQVYWLPESPTLANFEEVLGLGSARFGGPGALGPLKTSLVAATGGTLLALVIGILAAYAIGWLRAGGRTLPFAFLQLRMMPPVVIVIPLLVFWISIGLADTLHGLVLVYAVFSVPLVVWLMRSFLREVPPEIGEAATVDGCSHWAAFLKAILPQVKAGIAVTALFVFTLNWSDFLIAVMLSQDDVVTAPMQLNVMQTIAPQRRFGPQSALAVLLIVPPALLGLAIQRYLVRGLTFGAIRS
jgi:multiple sugar transport system permease protein